MVSTKDTVKCHCLSSFGTNIVFFTRQSFSNMVNLKEWRRQRFQYPHTHQSHTQRHIHTYTASFQFGVCAILYTAAFDTKHTYTLAVFGLVSFILGVILSNISDFLQCSKHLFCVVCLAWTIGPFSNNSHFYKADCVIEK